MIKETIIKTMKTEWFLTKLMFQTDTMCGMLYWFLVVSQYVIPLVNVCIWKLILDELTSIYLNDMATTLVWIYLWGYLLLQVIASILKQIVSVIYQKISRKASHNLDIAVMSKMVQNDTAFFDNPENADKVMAAQTSEVYITGNMCWTVDTLIRIIVFVVGLVMFLSYNPMIGIIYIIFLLRRRPEGMLPYWLPYPYK